MSGAVLTGTRPAGAGALASAAVSSELPEGVQNGQPAIKAIQSLAREVTPPLMAPLPGFKGCGKGLSAATHSLISEGFTH